jgi:hypothetical protein
MRNLLGRVASWLGRRPQPVLFAAGHPLGESEEEVKATLAAAIRGAFDSGVAAEKARVAEVLQAPGAATFHEIAADLLLGDATAAQAVAVLSRAEADAATRAGAIKSDLLESANVATLH